MQALASNSSTLSNDEIRRYSRHIIMPEVGIEGQRLLKSSSILLIGTGGLGSPLALYLAAAGVGRIGLVDYDVVDESNLQRQIIHGQSTLGTSKLESAAARIRDINPFTQIDTYNEPLTSANAMRLMEPYDVIIDGTDNFPTRYLVNDACVKLGKPNVYRQHLSLRGATERVLRKGRALLPLHVPGAAAARSGPQLRRGRSPRHFAGHHRHAAGHRRYQVVAGHRRADDRSHAPL